MRKVGVWIDRSKAVVGVIDDGKESVQTVESKAGRHARPVGKSGNSTPWGPKAPDREHQRERQYERRLVGFYRDVIKHLGQPEQLVLIGPARAKNELWAEIEKTVLRDVPVTIETADEMTDAQFMAKLRSFEMK